MKVFTRLIYFCFIALSLTACVSKGPTSFVEPDKLILTTCATAAAAAETLTTAADTDQLDADTRREVESALLVLDVMCNPVDGVQPTLDYLQADALNTALVFLIEEAAKHRKDSP